MKIIIIAIAILAMIACEPETVMGPPAEVAPPDTVIINDCDSTTHTYEGDVFLRAEMVRRANHPETGEAVLYCWMGVTQRIEGNYTGVKAHFLIYDYNAETREMEIVEVASFQLNMASDPQIPAVFENEGDSGLAIGYSEVPVSQYVRYTAWIE